MEVGTAVVQVGKQAGERPAEGLVQAENTSLVVQVVTVLQEEQTLWVSNSEAASRFDRALLATHPLVQVYVAGGDS